MDGVVYHVARTSLVRTDTEDGWFVEKTTGEGRTTTHSVGRNVGDIDPRAGRYEMTWDGLGRLLQNDDPAGGSTSLVRTDTDDGWFVEKTTGEGRTTHSVARNVGDEDRSTALPDGTVITSTEDSSGVQVIDYRRQSPNSCQPRQSPNSCQPPL